jgi:predicted nucleotidyltransferase
LNIKYILKEFRTKRGNNDLYVFEDGNNKADTAMQAVIREAQILFGDSLDKVALFGSYARGDFIAGESDLDVALFLQCEPMEIVGKRNALIDATVYIDYEHDIMVSYRIVPLCHWETFKDSLDLYKNIKRDGIFYYERSE